MSDWSLAWIGGVWLLWFTLYRFVTRAPLPDEETESAWSRMSYIAPMLASIALFVWQAWPGWLGARLIRGGPALFWIGLAVTIAGLVFSTWGRAALGSNWSGTVSLKEGHELVRAGPYRWIRHPMYAGVLLAMLGTSLALGSAHAIAGLVIAAAALAYKSLIEERWLREKFGPAYDDYARKSWALVPFIF